MNEETVYEITEVIESTDNYVQLLTMIHNELVEVNANLEVILQTSTFVGAILAGTIVGFALSYFIGKILRTR